MRLVLVIPPAGRHATEQRIALRDEAVEIGGASDCDAVLDDPSVGTSRVRLEKSGEHWVAIDRDGRGVCSIGGVPLRPREPRIVRPPHQLRLGNVAIDLVLDVEAHSHDGSTREVALRAAAFVVEIAPGRPRVRVVEGPRMGETLELTHARSYRVGRGKSCDLFLDAEDASREHFSVECEGERVVVRDLGSPRGTYLGGSRLATNRRAVWDPTRMLRAADSVFSLEVATQSSPERLLEALARIPDASRPAEMPRDEVDDLSRSESPAPTAAAPEESPAVTAPPSSPAVELPPEAPRSAAKGSRDPMFVIVLLAIVIGIAGAAALLALLLS